MRRIMMINCLFIFLSTGMLYAQPYAEYARRDAEDEILERTVEELDLTPKQQEQVYQQQRQYRQEQKELKTRYNERRKVLRQELDSPRLDHQRVEDVSGEIKDIEGRMFDSRLKSIMKMKEILTPEQFEAFSEGGSRLHKQQKQREQKRRGD